VPPFSAGYSISGDNCQAWHFFSIDIEDAAFLAWQSGEMHLTRWNRDRGLDHLSQPTAVLDEPGE
jgi:hypothetical protein